MALETGGFLFSHLAVVIFALEVRDHWKEFARAPRELRARVDRRRFSSSMRHQAGASPSLLTRAVSSIFAFVRLAEFEILFVLFFVIVFLLVKDLTSRPEYNQILVRREGHL
ncbi:uncharacterized protein LOC112346984 [Selaginella moellendorffii]|uniref:uncharacterized protein LOC112346984 n=1 Tax=Selaginella moellendorffii TaxID=88036 RepID=UPI000D1C47A2|nr:uncharacterized protein LOC112346984 [Selaginella moellendorffii]|eukprot:XP_024532805.1 uncharacterized protein LOC112346984 [Selaginella moellendorffii]